MMIEERRQKFKRKRRRPPEKNVEEQHTESKLDMAALLRELYKDYNENEKLSLKATCWEKFARLPTDPEKEPRDRYLRQLFVPTSYEITSSDGEITFDNADLLSNYYNFNVYEIIRQAKYNSLLEDNVEAYGYDVQDDFIQEYIIEKKINLSDLKTDKEIDELEEYVYQKVWERMPLHQRHAKLCPRRSSIMLTRLSDEVVAKYLKRDHRSISTNVSQDSGISDKDLGCSQSELTIGNEFGEGTSTSHSNIFEEVHTVQAVVPNMEIEKELDDTVESHEEVCNNDIGNDEVLHQIENGEETRPEVQNNDSNLNLSTSSRLFEQVKHVSTNCKQERISKKNRILNTSNEKMRELKQERQKTKRVKDIKDIEVGAPKKKKSRTAPSLKLRKVLTKSLNDFEIFFYENYKTQLGEGEIQVTNFLRRAFMKQTRVILLEHRLTVSLNRFESFYYKNYNLENFEGTLTEPEFLDDPIEDSCEVQFEEHDHTNLNDTSHAVNLNDSGIIADFSDSSNLCSENTTTNVENSSESRLNIREILNSQVTTSNTPDEDRIFEIFKQQQERNAKYIAWKNEINEKLSKTDKKDFDIHEYESKILDQLPSKNPAPLTRVLKAKTASEVARLFAAALQLVNNSNIEFKNVIPGKLADDNVEVHLLSKDKHHLQLESYQAPSVENRIEAFKRIRAQQGSRSSTQMGEPSTSTSIPYKKRKMK
ncbi:hypothetical protein AMK59_6632 [Oryctes borbonicus]|uniref:Condensin-2 complex subunit H2 C-terminal domain-containing protein n=1 Tax=Oryctes borbonicus TaxID=1629725 RepID=A0A0T6AV33_9SCAR|nr:hypothetical protein AMK59_6632 [Oryctes borbonicus]